MSDFREEEALGKVYDSQLARRLFGYLAALSWVGRSGRFADAAGGAACRRRAGYL